MLNTLNTTSGNNINANRIFGWVSVITALYLVRDVLNIGFPQSFFTVILFACFVLTTTEEGFCVFVFSTVLTLPGNEIRLIYFIIFLIKNKQSFRKLPLYNVFAIFILIIELGNNILYSSDSVDQTIYKYIVFCLYIVIPIIWAQYDFSKEAIVTAIKLFIFGVILVGLITVYITIQYQGWNIMVNGSSSLGYGLEDYISSSSMVTSNNRNYLSVFASVASALLLVLMATHRAKLVTSVPSLIVLLSVVLLTRSRTGIVCVVLIIIYWIILISSKRGRMIRGILIIIGVGLIIIGIHHFFPDVWQGVYLRFVNQADITNGRTYWNSLYLEKWKSNLFTFLFGYGANSFYGVVNIYGVPHNMIVDVLTCHGLVGLISLLLWLSIFLKNCLKGVKRVDLAYALLAPFIMLMGLMAGQYFSVAMNHLQFSFIILSTIAMRTVSYRYLDMNSDSSSSYR